MTLGGRIVIMPKADIGEFLRLIESQARDAHVPAADVDLHAARASRLAGNGSFVAAMFLVRRSADVGDAARGSVGQDRPGDGPAFRPDGSADDDLDHGPEGPFQRRRLRRARAAEFGRTADSARSTRDHGRRRPPAAERGTRRDRHPRFAGDGGLLQESRARPPKSRNSVGGIPATSAISTTTTISSSSIAPRT